VFQSSSSSSSSLYIGVHLYIYIRVHRVKVHRSEKSNVSTAAQWSSEKSLSSLATPTPPPPVDNVPGGGGGVVFLYSYFTVNYFEKLEKYESAHAFGTLYPPSEHVSEPKFVCSYCTLQTFAKPSRVSWLWIITFIYRWGQFSKWKFHDLCVNTDSVAYDTFATFRGAHNPPTITLRTPTNNNILYGALVRRCDNDSTSNRYTYTKTQLTYSRVYFPEFRVSDSHAVVWAKRASSARTPPSYAKIDV